MAGMAEPDVRSERVRVPPPRPLRPTCTMPGAEGTLGASWGAAPGRACESRAEPSHPWADVRAERLRALARDPYAP